MSVEASERQGVEGSGGHEGLMPVPCACAYAMDGGRGGRGQEKRGGGEGGRLTAAWCRRGYAMP